MFVLLHLICLFSYSMMYILLPFSKDTNYQNKNYFVIPITIGNDKRPFKVQIDTSSANTWVPLYDKIAKKNNVTLYDEDGIVSGFETYSNVVIGGIIHLKRFGFVQVDDYGKDFDDYPSGKIGLGYRGSYNNEFNLMSMFISSNIIEHRIFSIEYVNETNGNIYFDDYISSESPYVCNVTSYENINELYRESWLCSLSHVIFSESQPDFIERLNINSRILFDSAYDYILIPYKFYYLIKEKLFDKFLIDACTEQKGNNKRLNDVYYICESENMDIKKVNFTFIMQGYAYTLKMSALFKQINDTHYQSLIRFSKADNEDDDDEESIWMVGYPFMKHFILRYDYDHSQIGFANITQGSIIDMKDEWNEWYIKFKTNTEENALHTKNMHMLYAGVFILAVVLSLFIACLIIRARRRRKMEDIRPFMPNEEKSV